VGVRFATPLEFKNVDVVIDTDQLITNFTGRLKSDKLFICRSARFLQLGERPNLRVFDWGDHVTVAVAHRSRPLDLVDAREFAKLDEQEKLKFLVWLERRSVYTRATRSFRVYPDGSIENGDAFGCDGKTNLEVFARVLNYVDTHLLLRFARACRPFLDVVSIALSCSRSV